MIMGKVINPRYYMCCINTPSVFTSCKVFSYMTFAEAFAVFFIVLEIEETEVCMVF